MPLYSDFDITETEYAHFWAYMAGQEKKWLKFFNNILSTGVPLPYWNLEFLTKFTFHPHAMIVVMDIFYNSVESFQH